VRRTLHFWRAAICLMSVTEPETISSSQQRPQAIGGELSRLRQANPSSAAPTTGQRRFPERRIVRTFLGWRTPQRSNRRCPREQITGLLASYIALLHLCGHEALNNDPVPIIEKLDAWTIMRSASNDVYRVSKRDGEAVICPRLGTRKGCKSGL